MAAKKQVTLVCEGASKPFEIDHAERLLKFQKHHKTLNQKRLWELPSDSQHELQDGKLIKIGSVKSDKKS